MQRDQRRKMEEETVRIMWIRIWKCDQVECYYHYWSEYHKSGTPDQRLLWSVHAVFKYKKWANDSVKIAKKENYKSRVRMPFFTGCLQHNRESWAGLIRLGSLFPENSGRVQGRTLHVNLPGRVKKKKKEQSLQIMWNRSYVFFFSPIIDRI